MSGGQKIIEGTLPLDELEARLRKRREMKSGAVWRISTTPDPDCIAAADAIAALRRERDHYRILAGDLLASAHQAETQIVAEQDKVARLTRLRDEAEAELADMRESMQ